ncbi:BLUF domain-containing protein [Sulfitobacter albidus]|uniref:BLUF domain-containing protein n=1 Tax=Sulfitobacter albidus TaxID=2829501 RepID=A0A975JDC2_9RHOB|nr:BLUF domain-containing protein [Sulfitobacter albidus]QUJ76348.1 BLUF domain-containing protein [Sulfitobacter albidus]
MYFSTATGAMSRADMSDLVAASAARNAARGVTGMLAYNGRNFCQILEGEEETVTDLVSVIRADQRHAGFKVLGQKEISDRRFEDWSLRMVDALDFSEAVQAMDA